MDKIEQFIDRRFNNLDANWMNGNCYYFALILKDRFPQGDIVYDPVDGHFMLQVENSLYDWLGKHEMREVVSWNNFPDYDSRQYLVVVRDCIS